MFQSKASQAAPSSTHDAPTRPVRSSPRRPGPRGPQAVPVGNQAMLRQRAAAAVSGPGQRLPADIERHASALHGIDASGIRLHADAGARTAAASLHASAFTLGSDIAFNGRHAPDAPESRLLLLHEIRHAVQQRSAAATAEPEVGHRHSSHEANASDFLNPRIDPVARQCIQCAPEDFDWIEEAKKAGDTLLQLGLGLLQAGGTRHDAALQGLVGGVGSAAGVGMHPGIGGGVGSAIGNAIGTNPPSSTLPSAGGAGSAVGNAIGKIPSSTAPSSGGMTSSSAPVGSPKVGQQTPPNGARYGMLVEVTPPELSLIASFRMAPKPVG